MCAYNDYCWEFRWADAAICRATWVSQPGSKKTSHFNTHIFKIEIQMHKHKGMLFKNKDEKSMFSRHQVWNYSKEKTVFHPINIKILFHTITSFKIILK